MSCTRLCRSQAAPIVQQKPWHVRTRRLMIVERRLVVTRAATQPDAAGEQQQQHQEQQAAEEFVGLLPEEDLEVPGTYMDAMNSNTKLGKAVRAAVEELEHLGDLETEVLQQCDELLKKLGMKGSIFGSNPPPQMQQQQPDSSAKAGDG